MSRRLAGAAVAAAALIAAGCSSPAATPAAAPAAASPAAPATAAAASTPAPAAQPETAAAARAVARQFLGLYSADQYAASWTLLAPSVQRKVSQAAWVAVLQGCPPQSAGLAYNVSKATVTGSTAIVTVSLSGAAAAIGSASEAPHLHGGPVRIRPIPPQLLRPRQHQGGHRRGEGRRILRARS